MKALISAQESHNQAVREEERRFIITRRVAEALKHLGIDGDSLEVHEEPIIGVNGDYKGRKVMTIRIESFPCDRDNTPRSWI